MSNVVAIVRYSGEIKYCFIATNKLTIVTRSTQSVSFSRSLTITINPFFQLLHKMHAILIISLFCISIVNIITRETMRILSEKKPALFQRRVPSVLYMWDANFPNNMSVPMKMQCISINKLFKVPKKRNIGRKTLRNEIAMKYEQFVWCSLSN